MDLDKVLLDSREMHLEQLSIIFTLLAVCNAVILEPKAATNIMVGHEEASEGLNDSKGESIELFASP